MAPCVIGVDLGGTNVRAQALSPDGKALGNRYEGPSFAQSGTQRIIEALAQAVVQAAQGVEDSVVGVGLAIPGHIDDAAGLVRWAPNFGDTVDGVFRYWENVPIKEPLSRLLTWPVVMGNDANVAALGEYMYGVGKGTASCLLMMTLGTGIGSGVVLGQGSVSGDARYPMLLLGGNKGGVELGHTLIHHHGLDCNSGAYGSLEAYCQRDAIVARATHRLRRGRKSVINDLVEGNLGQVTPRLIAEAAEKGDALALEVWDEFATYLGAGIGSAINTFAPDVVAIGGKISQAHPYFLDRAIIEAQNVAIPSLFADARIVIAEHEDDAGILGAGALAHQTFATES